MSDERKVAPSLASDDHGPSEFDFVGRAANAVDFRNNMKEFLAGHGVGVGADAAPQRGTKRTRTSLTPQKLVLVARATSRK